MVTSTLEVHHYIIESYLLYPEIIDNRFGISKQTRSNFHQLGYFVVVVVSNMPLRALTKKCHFQLGYFMWWKLENTGDVS